MSIPVIVPKIWLARLGGEEGSVTAVVEDDEGADDKPRSHEGERKGQDVR